MKLFCKTIVIFLSLSVTALAQNPKSYKVNTQYKAYWGGFTVAEITSQTTIKPGEYDISAGYTVKGLAAIFGKSENTTMAQGIVSSSGEFRPELYESSGNFGKLTYYNRATFDPDTLKVKSHEQELNLREDTEYIPIADEEKYGFDPMTIFLNMMTNQNFKEEYKKLYTERQFGGIFVSEQTFICKEEKIIGSERRSVFEGEAVGCAIDGKRLSGQLKSTKPRKKRKRSRVDDDQESLLWFGKMDGFDA
ncbi:MAG: DUF3108 domain-containing protein, partial [Kordiimonadaceae bacterium]|nr:DUF3108 domain-containing protein [Kordiimonadaceae bacterium]